jgi:hypothetical protein
MNERAREQQLQDEWLKQRRPGDPVLRPGAAAQSIQADSRKPEAIERLPDFRQAVERVLAAVETSGGVPPRTWSLTWDEMYGE